MTVLLRDSQVDVDEAAELIRSVEWYHRLEVLPGLVSPGLVPPSGTYDASSYLDSLAPALPKDLTGARVLDVGAWDGPLSFEARQRGADVVSIDVQNPEKTGFSVLNRLSGLEIPYMRSSVYELPQHFCEEFDFVLFMNVFSVLKSPQAAFDAIAAVMKVGGILFTDGTGQGFELRDVTGTLLPLEWLRTFGEMLDRLDEFGVPFSLANQGSNGSGERFLPNRAALTAWLVSAGFEKPVVWRFRQDPMGRTAVGATAQKTRPHTAIEHRLVGEEGGYSAVAVARGSS